MQRVARSGWLIIRHGFGAMRRPVSARPVETTATCRRAAHKAQIHRWMEVSSEYLGSRQPHRVRVEVHLGETGEYCLLVERRLGLEAPVPEVPSTLDLFVG